VSNTPLILTYSTEVTLNDMNYASYEEMMKECIDKKGQLLLFLVMCFTCQILTPPMLVLLMLVSHHVTYGHN
jgi:hypothetical protein